MNGTASHVVWIPLLPLAAAAAIALMPRRMTRWAMGLAIGSMAGALVLSVAALVGTLGWESADPRFSNVPWFPVGSGQVSLGILLDPLSAIMLTMVSGVGLAIFVFSVGYMAHDDNATRFFGFLALFAAAMLGLVIANSLLLLFVCWELMGLASYLLIGFWFQRPAAAAAAKKAFIVTRIGDLGLFLGMLWWFHEAGTLLFYDGGEGCLEGPALAGMTATMVTGSLSVATAVALLLFVGAIGKSGQVPLHVWLPDAMEGPTPVSALIHAATMVAAGVFLMARVYPLMTGGLGVTLGDGGDAALVAITWVGAVTAFFAALVAVGQSDLKRILAYSTVSQLGYMFVGLGTGGVGVAMFHLVTHAVFKSLLFLGAGSVIHGCGDEQDIRRMGGLRRWMPVTFATYAVGMMALAGVPLFFSGFWSKDEILHEAWLWEPSRWPFVLGLAGAVLTAFYMTRQVATVFFGPHRGRETAVHESPGVMTVPLVALAVGAVGLGFIGTPAWPWFQAYLAGNPVVFDAGRLVEAIPLMLVSTGVVALGIGAGWWAYGRTPRRTVEAPDPLEARVPRVFGALRDRMWVDELYEITWVRGQRGVASGVAWLDRWVIGGLVAGTGALFRGVAVLARWTDERGVNAGFDAGCAGTRLGGEGMSRLQGGRAQRYLSAMALGGAVLVGVLVWGLGSG